MLVVSQLIAIIWFSALTYYSYVTTVELHDRVTKLEKREKEAQELKIEMERLLPPLRTALQTFSEFNKTY